MSQNRKLTQQRTAYESFLTNLSPVSYGIGGREESLTFYRLLFTSEIITDPCQARYALQLKSFNSKIG